MILSNLEVDKSGWSEVLTAMSTKTAVFEDVALSSLVDTDQSFWRA
jgi:hypothetical protein